MSRPLRLEFPDALYHITSRGDRREDIYDDDTDREEFLTLFSTGVERYNWVCYAYILMKNHYHLLIQTPDGNLSKGMRQLNGVYTQFYNRRHRKVGHLFQGRYKSILVDRDNYLLELSRYIVLNPVKAGLVKQVELWPWRSYQAMTGLSDSPEWLASEYLLLQFSKQRKAAIRKFKLFVDAGIKNGPIWSQLTKQVYLGDSQFVEKAQAYLSEKSAISRYRRCKGEELPSYYFNMSAMQIVKMKRSFNLMPAGHIRIRIQALFCLHFARIGKIVRKFSKALLMAKSYDPSEVC